MHKKTKKWYAAPKQKLPKPVQPPDPTMESYLSLVRGPNSSLPFGFFRALWAQASEQQQHAFANRLAAMPYDTYLYTNYWRGFSFWFITEQGRQCALCGDIACLRVQPKVQGVSRMAHTIPDSMTVICQHCYEKQRNQHKF